MVFLGEVPVVRSLFPLEANGLIHSSRGQSESDVLGRSQITPFRREPAGQEWLWFFRAQPLGGAFSARHYRNIVTGGVAIALPPATMVQTFGLEVEGMHSLFVLTPYLWVMLRALCRSVAQPLTVCAQSAHMDR